jgi:hypothetical protein
MIEVGAGALLLALALLVLCCIDPVMQLLGAAKHYRQAQGDSILERSGLLDTSDEAEA